MSSLIWQQQRTISYPTLQQWNLHSFSCLEETPYMPLNQLLEQVKRYLGTDQGIPDLEALQNLLQMTTTQIKYASGKRNQNFKQLNPMSLRLETLVLVRNHTSKAFQEKYQDSFRIVRLLGKNQLEVKIKKVT